jgi:hypothetical protein
MFMLTLYLAACQTPEAVTTVFKCSWGWTQIVSETCRVSLQLLINILPSCITLVLYIYLDTVTLLFGLCESHMYKNRWVEVGDGSVGSWEWNEWRELYFPRIYWELITNVGCTEKKNSQLSFLQSKWGIPSFLVFFTSSQLSIWIFNVFHYNLNFIITDVILSPPQFCYTEISLCVKRSYKKWRQTVQKYSYVNARKTDIE